MALDSTDRTPLPEPWWSFLLEVDEALSAPVELHCLGRCRPEAIPWEAIRKARQA